MALGVLLLFISVMFVNEACPDDAKVCPNGSLVYRDPLNNCLFPTCLHEDLTPYCTSTVESVEVSGSLVRTVSSLIGGGFTVYSVNVTACPVVAPTYTSGDCRSFANKSWVLAVNCSLVEASPFSCPSGFYEFEGYKWINCSNSGFSVYCEPRFEQWVEYNCGIDVIQ
jgi:hypothetical protein